MGKKREENRNKTRALKGDRGKRSDEEEAAALLSAKASFFGASSGLVQTGKKIGWERKEDGDRLEGELKEIKEGEAVGKG